MLRTSIRTSIHFNEHELRRIRCVLNHIEARYSRLANAILRIFYCRLPERFDRLRFNLYVHVNDLHRSVLYRSKVLALRSPGLYSFFETRTGKQSASFKPRSV
jgi:hypothetical protein